MKDHLEENHFLEWKNISEEQREEIQWIGFSYIRQGRYEIALPLFSMLVEINGESIYDVQTLGALYLQTDQAEKGIKILEKALQLAPEDAPTQLNYAKALFSLGYREMALQKVRKLRKHRKKTIARQARALILAYGDRH